MRLIDADAMLKRNKLSIYDTTDLEEMLRYEPTAYDVDKVVDKLSNKMFSAECYNDNFNGCEISNLLCMGDVYEIVKEGGIDE